MKNIFLLASIISSINCFSQDPNPDLFQTWYLYDYYSTDDNIHHPISAITPSISPYVTFTEAFSFNGEGACNSFNGTYSSPFADVILFNNFSSTLLLCGSSNHTSFEGAYFSFMQSGGQYYLSGVGDNMTLVISNPIFINYVFGNSQLHSPNFDLEQIFLNPNPAKSVIYINANRLSISKIQIINSLGQNVKTVNNDFDAIAISDLAKGLYIVKMETSLGTINKKIIKE